MDPINNPSQLRGPATAFIHRPSVSKATDTWIQEGTKKGGLGNPPSTPQKARTGLAAPLLQGQP